MVPFLFTQSGIKPLTSVKMSERYVKLFNAFKEADSICVVGFGFNSDDGYINGMFRELIEDYNKKVIILHYIGSNNVSTKLLLKQYQSKLRIDNSNGIKIIKVDSSRHDIETEKIWYSSLKQSI